jgi:hypothetical protein
MNDTFYRKKVLRLKKPIRNTISNSKAKAAAADFFDPTKRKTISILRNVDSSVDLPSLRRTQESRLNITLQKKSAIKMKYPDVYSNNQPSDRSVIN